MKYFLGTLVIVAVGAGVYYLCRKKSIKETETSTNQNKNKKADISEDFSRVAEGLNNNIEKEIEQTVEKKEGVHESIVTRHQEAAREMEKSLKNILDDTTQSDITSENEDDLSEIDDALDKLLDE